MEEKTKILIVEDEAMIVDMYRMRLEAEGYEVLTTDKGSEALALAEEKKPAVILLDVILPEVDGFAVLQSLKNNFATHDIPVLMLTNLSQESDIERATTIGVSDYFVKAQHTPSEILQKIRELTNKS